MTDRIASIKELRRATGLGLREAVDAMNITGNNYAAALAMLQRRIHDDHPVVTGPKLNAGRVVSYVHNDRIGALVDVRCETDFTANTEEFRRLCHNVAQHVVGLGGAIMVEQLLEQPWIRDTSKTIKQLVSEVVAVCREHVEIYRFMRYELPPAQYPLRSK